MPISDFFNTLRAARPRSSAIDRRLIHRRRQIQRLIGTDRFRHGGRGGVIQTDAADNPQHRRDISVRRSNVTGDELIGGFQFREEIHAHNVSRNSS